MSWSHILCFSKRIINKKIYQKIQLDEEGIFYLGIGGPLHDDPSHCVVGEMQFETVKRAVIEKKMIPLY